jgi:predicted Zn-dependent protease
MGRTRDCLNRLACGLLTGAMLIFLSGCYTVPITGRQAMILLDEGTEMQMGASSYADIKKEAKISTDPAVNAQVQRVGKRVAAATGLNYNWEFTVFDDPKTVNAFCLPGGKVGIYTGILKVTQNDAGLATVVAHEVAHAAARHGAERYSQDVMLGLGGAVLGEALGGADESDKDNEKWKVAYGLGSTLLVALPHSRMQESEADRIGLIYMAKADYDPREAVALWERFKAYKDQQGQSQIEFLSTHPTDETRIRDLKAHLPEALRYYRPGRAEAASAVTTTPAGLLAVPAAKAARVMPTATMFLKAECPHCGNVNRVPFTAYQGQSIRCFSCGRTFK